MGLGPEPRHPQDQEGSPSEILGSFIHRSLTWVSVAMSCSLSQLALLPTLAGAPTDVLCGKGSPTSQGGGGP